MPQMIVFLTKENDEFLKQECKKLNLNKSDLIDNLIKDYINSKKNGN